LIKTDFTLTDSGLFQMVIMAQQEDGKKGTDKLVDILKNVKDPETGLNIIDLGIVYGYTVNDKITEIVVDFQNRTPVCYFCKALAWDIIDKISNDIVNVLKKEGYKNIRIAEYMNPKIVYNTSDE